MQLGQTRQALYTCGYQNLKNGASQLVELARAYKAVVVDIRYSPTSKNVQWQGDSLRALFAEAGMAGEYKQCKDLGNKNYFRRDLGISLYLPDRGIPASEQLHDFAPGYPLVRLLELRNVSPDVCRPEVAR